MQQDPGEEALIIRIGCRIKLRRTQLNLSVDELAQRIGKNRSTIYRYESGGIDKVSVDMLEPLAKALETTPAFLMGLDNVTGELASTHVIKDGVTASYISSNAVQVRHMEQWVQELGHVEFSDEESTEIINYAKYLLFKRNSKGRIPT